MEEEEEEVGEAGLFLLGFFLVAPDSEGLEESISHWKGAEVEGFLKTASWRGLSRKYRPRMALSYCSQFGRCMAKRLKWRAYELRDRILLRANESGRSELARMATKAHKPDHHSPLVASGAAERELATLRKSAVG